MPALAIISGAALLALALHRLFHAALLARRIARWSPPCVPDDKLPRVALLVGLRGADPDLEHSLHRLLTQDYPDYIVHLVIDSRDDPAWPVAQRAVADTNADHATISEFANDPADGPVNCTNAKIVQAARTLGDSIDVLATADGDLVPHPTWLRELVAPIADNPSIGATYGTKWFIPPDRKWGSIARYVWTALLVAYIERMSMAWGGCFAIRASAVRNANLIDRWAKLIALDAASPGDLREQNLSLRFVPSLFMPNRESCSLPFLANYLQRSLTWTRLYHDRAWIILAHAASSILLLLLTLATAITGPIVGDTHAALIALAAILLYYASLATTISIIDRAARTSLERRVEPTRRPPLPRTLLSLPLLDAVRALAVTRASLSRRIRWRAITIEIKGRNDLRVISNEPMRTAQPTDPRTSL